STRSTKIDFFICGLSLEPLSATEIDLSVAGFYARLLRDCGIMPASYSNLYIGQRPNSDKYRLLVGLHVAKPIILPINQLLKDI
ncbi:hypothetical protein, partial [Escherichia coli]|uniref:hypothetical protein n=1 Tax=Escherichia coli TaxID=562 RepID=UPI001966B81C